MKKKTRKEKNTKRIPAKKMPVLPRICIAATGDTPETLFACARNALQHTPLVELRLDWLRDPRKALPRIFGLLRAGSRLQRGRPVVLQATCRRRENGGRFRGTVAEQIEILRRAAAAGCRVLDLEIESAEAAGREAVESLRRRALLILSFHDFQRTPALAAAASRLRRFPAEVYKLAPTATRQSDNCRTLDFLSSVATRNPKRALQREKGPREKQKQEQWVAFSMGAAGVPSRVLALSRGSVFVYAACPPPRRSSSALVRNRNSKPPAFSAPSAPGQIDSEVLRNSYRAEKLSRRSALYGLLGNPVGHSLGAAIHNAAFRSAGVDAVYVPLLSSDLKDFRSAAGRYPLAGFSVTIPHKQGILRWVDRRDRTVQAAGAANTVRVRRGRWEAINTDVEGIVVPLRKALRLGSGEHLPRGFRALIVGNGGAARAAWVALRELKCRDISVTGRSPARVRAFTSTLGGEAIPMGALRREQFDLLVHATSVGMWPKTQACLLQPEQVNARLVFDLVYNPAETRLLEIARARGCRTISGLEMFLAQAARQFEYWTGKQAPLRRMRATAQQELYRLQQLRRGSGAEA